MRYYKTTRTGLNRNIRSASSALLEDRTPGLALWTEFLRSNSPTMGDYRHITDKSLRDEALNKAITRAEQSHARLMDGTFVWNVESLNADGRITFVVLARLAGLKAEYATVDGKAAVKLAYASAELRERTAEAIREAIEASARSSVNASASASADAVNA
jgi:hypothetical protein